jgi:hypothetical protein
MDGATIAGIITGIIIAGEITDGTVTIIAIIIAVGATKIRREEQPVKGCSFSFSRAIFCAAIRLGSFTEICSTSRAQDPCLVASRPSSAWGTKLVPIFAENGSLSIFAALATPIF